MSKPKVTQEYIRSLLDYDPETGDFTWKERPRDMFLGTSPENVNRVWRRWNNRYSGKTAGSVGRHGYWFLAINNVKQRAHRLAFLYYHGVTPKYIDHIDHDPMNNRIVNLRGVTHRENLMNQKMRKNNTSGVMGVYFRNDISKWAAQIAVKNKVIALGTFDDKNDAIIARKQGEVTHGFHENHGT